MKKNISLFLLVCLFFMEKEVLGQSKDYGKNIVQVLSAKGFKGRGYVQRGDKKAARYLSRQFKKLGLVPFAANGGVYVQPYTVAVNYFPAQMQVAIDGKKLLAGTDYLMDAMSPALKGSFLIVHAERKALLDTAGLFALTKKAAGGFLYFDNTDDSTESAEEKRTIDQNQRYLQADTALPVKGLLIYSPQKLTWTVLSRQLARPLVELHTLIGPDAKTVKINTYSRLDTAYATQNILGFVKGTVYPDSFLVISAHYDHLGKMGKKAMFYGANDNASGTGFLMDLAQYFTQHRSPYSIAFMLFSGEELGLKGSHYYVEHPAFPLKDIKFLWNFDMAGTGKEGIQVVNSTLFPKQFDELTAINDSLHLLPAIKPRGAAANSDHYWFYKQGVPCFFSYTLGGVNYHDVNDTYESLPFDAWDNYLKLVKLFLEKI